MKNKKQLYCKIGMAIGVLAVILGFVLLSKTFDNVSSDPGYASFGADFYTLQYKATRYAAQNVEKVYLMTTVIKNGLSYILIVVGLFDVVYFLLKAEETKSYDKIIELIEKSQIKAVSDTSEVEVDESLEANHSGQDVDSAKN